MKGVLEFKSIAELNCYLEKNGLELKSPIPSSIVMDNREYTISLVFDEEYTKQYQLSINQDHQPPYVIISDCNSTGIDFIDLKKK